MQEEFSFEKLDVYHKAKALAKEILIFSKQNKSIDMFLFDSSCIPEIEYAQFRVKLLELVKMLTGLIRIS